MGLTLSEYLLGILLVFPVDYKISELIITNMSLVFQRTSVCLIDLFFFIPVHQNTQILLLIEERDDTHKVKLFSEGHAGCK